MNKTLTLFGVALVLALFALVLGLPKNAPAKGTPPPVDTGHVTPPPPPQGTWIKPSTDPGAGPLDLQGRLSMPAIPQGDTELFVTADVEGKTKPGLGRAPVDLALVIDRSCSMAGEKLEHAKRAAIQLAQTLNDQDRLAIIDFGSDVRILPGRNVTSANRRVMIETLQGMRDEGGTNIGEGLAAAAAELRRAIREYKVNRVVLLSDGQPTDGITDPRALSNLAQRLHREGISVSAIGVGTDFNEDLMHRIAELGSGAYAYLESAERIASVFQKDLQMASHLVARDVTLSFELPEGAELEQVLGYESQQDARTVRVHLPDISAGQLERVVAKVKVRGGKVGEKVSVTNLRVDCVDVDQAKKAWAQMPLVAEVTANEQEILSKRDKQATVYAAQAVAAANLEKAAKKLEEGDRKEALAIAQESDKVFDEAEAVAGKGAMREVRAQHVDVLRGMQNAPASAMPAEVKEVKAKALKDFGRVGSVY